MKTINLKPIEVQIVGQIRQSSQEICMAFLDTNRWSEFKGYAILPGIEKADFETKTPQWVGSRIKVWNTDGSSHVEEIVEWDVSHRIALRFEEFSSPLQHFATHFLEVWEFRPSMDGTAVSRSIAIYPKGMLGWLLLVPISKLMKKAFEKNLAEMSRE